MPSRQDIQALAESIASKFDVDKVILFGSQAHGTATGNSDVDLLVVMDFNGGAFSQAMKIWTSTRPAFPTDIIVRTSAEVRRRLAGNDPLIRDAIERGITLHDRSLAGVG